MKKPDTAKEKQNGGTDDSVMIIDSDDEQVPPDKKATDKFVDKPEFDDEEDPLNQDVTQTLDLSLGTAALQIAVLPVIEDSSEDAGGQGPSLLREKIIFAVSSVMNDVYLVTLPLTPPSPESKARPELRTDLMAGNAWSGVWGQSIVSLGGQRRRSDGIALNLTPKTSQADPYKVIIASHCREASGTLRLWEVSLESKERTSRPVEPFQTEFLPKPLSAISFNPNHKTQILAISPNDGVRVYDYALPAVPADPEASGSLPAQGSWLLTLYQPFAKGLSSRKPILDAAWIAHGRAIFTLLADGMWGIWDIDGASPSSSGASMSSKLKSGIRGAAIAAFSVSGYIEGTSSLRNTTSQGVDDLTEEFVPMTPHTRRQATASLGSNGRLDRLAAVHGGLAVMSLPSSGKALQDESMALWVGGLDQVFVISGVQRFWDSQLRRGAGGGVNLFSGAQPTKMIKLLDLRTGLVGERCCGAQLTLSFPSPKTHDLQDSSGLPVDVVIQGESRLVFVQESDENHNTGWLGSTRRPNLFSKGDKSTAIIVHGQQAKARASSYDLSTFRPGSLRQRPSLFDNNGKNDGGANLGDGDGRQDTMQLVAPPRTGFEFADTLNAAADVMDDHGTRNVDMEMLDIMQIDKELSNMEDSRGKGRKKVVFEED